ncbi:Similar to Arr2: Phosrestin-1 (Drosophila melanogaster) [Cotesia congregata]|uniref:Similar to Arr2: Phosrestin-1 (Drosophila melanogaster) n=1 Tax=Cotesia congregata TaxID=51543 RepID=A0A8J2MMR9_COTCN|nr:Similar to Arr2: Phosrestin-1 (Drosophila melanogaster) [Cotesia congregata]
MSLFPQAFNLKEATHPISPSINASTFNNQWYFRKESRNEKLILYLINRDLIVNNGKIDKLFGVIKADPEYIKNKRVYGQVTLTFRYGREDEEYMGIKFCTEAIICFAQLYPPCSDSDHQEPSTALQVCLSSLKYIYYDTSINYSICHHQHICTSSICSYVSRPG